MHTSFTHAHIYNISNQPAMVMFLDWNYRNLLAMTCSLCSPLENAAICERWHCKNIHCVSYALNLLGTSCLSGPSHLLTLGNLGKTWLIFFFHPCSTGLRTRLSLGLKSEAWSGDTVGTARDKCPELNIRVLGILTACLILRSLSKLKTSRRRVGFSRNGMFS